MGTNMNMIEVRSLSRDFGQLQAVKSVSFEVAEGELFGFLGPNGAGKTTTINVLCTLLRPTSGTASVNGFDVAQQRSEVRRSIGLVFQQPTVDEYLSAEQNLRFHAYAYNVPSDVREPRIRELLTMVELWDRRKGSVRTFSGGMKRLASVVALVGPAAALAAPPFFHNLPEGSNACKWWPAAGGSGELGTYHARQEVNGNGAVPMFMTTAPAGCMNMPGLNYPNY